MRKIKKICKECNKKYEVYPSKQNRPFCSKSCFIKYAKSNFSLVTGKNHPNYKQVETNCDCCGKAILRHPYRLKKNNYQFCNKKCFSKFVKYWAIGTIKKGNIPWNYKTSDSNINGFSEVYWREKARKILNIIEPSIHVHHIDGDITNNNFNNLFPLSHSLHMRLHWMIRKNELNLGELPIWLSPNNRL